MKPRALPPSLRTLALLAFTLLVVLLPALAAGARIDRPALPDEIARIRVLLAETPDEGAVPGSIPGRYVLRATLPARIRELGVAALGDPAAREQAVTYARFVALLSVLLLSCSVYLALATTRGRGTAVLACVALAVLPPIGLEGCVLRPETPAAACATLALATLLSALVVERPLRQIAETSRWVMMIVLFLGSGALCGLGAAFLPSTGIQVLLPSALLLLCTASLTLALPRVLRRRPGTPIPMRAMWLRFLPWLIAMLVWLWLCAIVILFGYEPETGVQRASRSEVGLWPASLWLRVPLLALAAAGAARWIWSAGRRLSRGARLSSDAVLLVNAALLLVPWVKSEPRSDALVAACACAMLIGEGAMLAVGTAIRRIVRGGLPA